MSLFDLFCVNCLIYIFYGIDIYHSTLSASENTTAIVLLCTDGTCILVLSHGDVGKLCTFCFDFSF